jgi:RNA-directed DNA polymerase
MPHSHRRLIAMGIARAMLAGPPRLDSVTARIQQATGQRAAWVGEVAAIALRVGASAWPAMDVIRLANMLLAEPTFGSAFGTPAAPRLRRYILRHGRQRQAPLGLEQLALPRWDTVSDLAQWLGVDLDVLDWLGGNPAARRKAPLIDQHYHWQWRTKPRGGLRLLEVPRWALKTVQRRLHEGLLALVPPHEAACGFTRGRGVLDHARVHASQPVLLHFDLRDFFGSIRASRVHALFETLGYSPSVARYLTALTTSRVPESILQRLRDDGLITFCHAQRLRDAHLPQGAPTSPALANLSAFGLDLRIDGFAAALGARYSRYADDLVLSGPRSLLARAGAVEVRVGSIAIEEAFDLQHRKTHLTTAARAQTVCGVVVNAHANLPRSEFDRLKAQLHRCRCAGLAAAAMASGTTAQALRAHLLGRVSWAAQINPLKAARLQRLIGPWLDEVPPMT